MKCIVEGTIVANIDTEFGLDSIAQAHEYLESGQANGKVLISMA